MYLNSINFSTINGKKKRNFNSGSGSNFIKAEDIPEKISCETLKSEYSESFKKKKSNKKPSGKKEIID